MSILPHSLPDARKVAVHYILAVVGPRYEWSLPHDLQNMMQPAEERDDEFLCM